MFTRQVYRDIVLDSFRYCQANKGLRVHCWVIMSNHLHAILSTPETNLSDVIRDLKGHTSKAIYTALQSETESRREWMNARFIVNAMTTARNDNFKVWKHDNHPLQLKSFTIEQKVEYIHNNPVRAGIVEMPHHYVYSSARDYVDDHLVGKGLLSLDKLW